MNLKTITAALEMYDHYLLDYINTPTYRGKICDLPAHDEYILDAESFLYQAVCALHSALDCAPTDPHESEVSEIVECL